MFLQGCPQGVLKSSVVHNFYDLRCNAEAFVAQLDISLNYFSFSCVAQSQFSPCNMISRGVLKEWLRLMQKNDFFFFFCDITWCKKQLTWKCYRPTANGLAKSNFSLNLLMLDWDVGILFNVHSKWWITELNCSQNEHWQCLCKNQSIQLIIDFLCFQSPWVPRIWSNANFFARGCYARPRVDANKFMRWLNIWRRF